MALPMFVKGKKNNRQESINRNSKWRHLKMECTGGKAKEVTLRQYMFDSRRAFPKFYAEINKELDMEASKKRMQKREEVAIQNGHQPVALDIAHSMYNGKRCLRAMLVCKECRKCLNALGKNGKKECVGKKERNWHIAPGAAFWRFAREQRKVKYACEMLGITKAEYKKINVNGGKWREWLKPRTLIKKAKNGTPRRVPF